MIHQKPRPSATEQEAADWYARLNSQVIDTRDVTDFEAWRKNPENRKAYDEISLAAANLRGLRGDPALEAMADDALERAARRQKARTIGARVGVGVMLAAGLAVGAIGLTGASGERFESGVGERRVVRLEDGSEVTLNTNSRIAVRLSRGERRVSLLRGQAFFDVAHDQNRPFVVSAGQTSVTAVGTRFDVYRRADAVQVTLTEGKVAVREREHADRPWMLSPGQKIVVGKAPTTRPANADVTAETSWTLGQLVFHDAPLSQAVAEVNRYSEKKITLASDAPHDLLINGTFPTGDVDGFTLAVSNMLNLETHPINSGRAIELRSRLSAKP